MATDLAVTQPEQRVDGAAMAADGYRKLMGLELHVQSALPRPLLELVKLRASILNGCSFCVDMHSGDALKAGEESRRLFSVAAWHEAPWFSDTERAALALTDALTRMDDGVSDELWAAVVKQLGEADAVELVLAIGTINVWNRLNAAFRTPPPALT